MLSRSGKAGSLIGASDSVDGAFRFSPGRASAAGTFALRLRYRSAIRSERAAELSVDSSAWRSTSDSEISSDPSAFDRLRSSTTTILAASPSSERCLPLRISAAILLLADSPGELVNPLLQ